ncbi:MAG: DNA repair protein RadA [Gammaproteobacteria bacterium]|nr:MAG: DNA repair protein RadA [Gammaproteobacteria bacterium]
MAKPKALYTCRECGAQTPKWAGRCPECGAWNSLQEEVASRFTGYAGKTSPVIPLSKVPPLEEKRLTTSMEELDRVLGGGIVPGSVVLIGGDPGIGKSTLLLQTLTRLSDHLACLYVTGEESPQQVSLRAERMKIQGDVQLLSETQLERILATAEQVKPQVMVIDSIQTLYTETLPSAPGTVGQVRESAARLVRFAKQRNVAIFLVGHVTKEGGIAGPRVLEHMVDTVLYFEGQGGSRFRVIRAIKNRFGATNELGVFAMTEKGLRQVSNPSAIFLSRHEAQAPGSAVMVTMEGSRPLLVEVQALVDESHLSSPRRLTLGLDANRLGMLLAVLHRHGGVVTYDQDVFVNVVGGVRVLETAADLAVLMAILSSLRGHPLPRDLVVFGEVGLSGEIRPVPGGQERLKEAAKHGFSRAIVPAANAPKGPFKGMEVMGARRIDEALASL